MAFFLNNNTISVFKAAKQLTAQSRDFTIHIKTIERSDSIDEIMSSYEKAALICGEMEELSMKAGLATGVGASEDRVDQLIQVMKIRLKKLISCSPVPTETLQKIMEYESSLADEIISDFRIFSDRKESLD
ncbi:MAG: hypothetical protein IKU09_02295 [Firmicutes bacterium]|nr:hypothetical protein [Bacillota bacterium]